MPSKIKYYSDVFSSGYYFPIILMIIFGAVFFYFSYSIYSYFDGFEKFLFTPVPIAIYLGLIYFSFQSYYKKVAVDEKGNVSIPGPAINNNFIPNTYYIGPAGGHKAKPVPKYQFNKSNIKTIKLLDYSEVAENLTRHERLLISKNEVLQIEFKKPLMFSGHGVPLGKHDPLDKIYISINNARDFMQKMR